jgi:hypothetical protein
VALGAAGRRGRRNSGEAGGLGRAGAGAGWSWGYGGAIWGFGPGGDAAGDCRRRRTPMAVTVELVPVRWGDQWRSQGRVELLWGSRQDAG